MSITNRTLARFTSCLCVVALNELSFGARGSVARIDDSRSVADAASVRASPPQPASTSCLP